MNQGPFEKLPTGCAVAFLVAVGLLAYWFLRDVGRTYDEIENRHR